MDGLREGRAHAAGVDDQRAAVLAQHLDVRVPPRHHGRALGPELAIEDVGRGLRQQVDHVRARRAVEEAQLAAAAERQREAVREAAQEGELAGIQAIATPVDRLQDHGVVGMLADQGRVEQVVVVVAQDAGAAELPQPVHHLAGRDAERRHVAEADELVDTALLCGAQHRAQGCRVAMEVGDQADPALARHRPST